MEQINRALFLMLNAPGQPDPFWFWFAKGCAEYLLYLIPVLLTLLWLRTGADARKILLRATVTALLALGINQLIGLVWQHPRPFMIGLGHTLVPHVADSSFPSDHMTLFAGIALGFLFSPVLRKTGFALALLSLPVGWSRIYLGVHFPFDMLGAWGVALFSGFCIQICAVPAIDALYKLAEPLYRTVFGSLIRRGVVRP